MRTTSFKLSLLAIVLALFGTMTQTSLAGTLFVGTDNTPTRNVLETDLSGNVVQTVGPLDATGFAIDIPNNIVYFGSSGAVITPRSLSNPNTTVGPSFTPDSVPAALGEDMTFLAGSIWRTYSNGTVTQIDPATGHVTASFSTGYEALGITAYNGDLLISDSSTQRVREYTTAGALVGGGVNFLATDASGPLTGEIGGLALDATNNVIYLGYFGEVLHYKPDGTFLGSFAVPANQDPGRFVDGLEGFGAVPTPMALPGGIALAALAFIVHRRMRPRRA